VRQYGLEKRHNLEIDDSLYSLSLPFDIKGLNVPRYGVRCFDEISKHPQPNHHLARFLNAEQSLALDEVSFRSYLAGEMLNIEKAPGYHLVSYQGLNAGFVRAVDGKLKNLYPKGLRRR
jgi:NOL1/NOP2/fmu family ribosome biogenesis protein